MNKYKLIAREPTTEYMEMATKYAARTLDTAENIAGHFFDMVFDAAPDIETEAEKKALELLATWDTATMSKVLEIIRALLRERGKA